MAEPVTAEDLRRLRWQCRRGMLENDVILARFLDRHAGTLERETLGHLRTLLEFGDNELWDLICGRAACPDARLSPTLQMLREA
ncbi:MAG: succinate dehydrogenase assembly factor 2 [Gammaproteobacteria bacterium]|nr:succinate dehydrogenase assembly factor 2 [Gammaproteobacteria bacterium]